MTGTEQQAHFSWDPKGILWQGLDSSLFCALYTFLQNMQCTSITAQTNENACENESQSNIFPLRVKAGFLTKKS